MLRPCPLKPIAFVSALWLVSMGAFGCAKSDSVGDTFQNLGGSGGSGGGDGGSGAGTSTTSSMGGNTTTTTSASTTTSSSTTSGSTTTTTSGTTSTLPTCNDGAMEGEPNNSESTAKNLGTIGDSDGDGDSISGVINGPNDTDWFKYVGTDNFGNSVDPSRVLKTTGNIRICKFLQCTKGTLDPYLCPGDSTPDTSPDGRPGCCSFNEIVYDPTPFSQDEFDCSTSDDGASIYIRVDNPNEQACVEYTIDYHF